MHNSKVFEQARISRDARFDGRFFVGVHTTGIYCRPICPARTPKSENVSFYPTAAAAGEAGLRPCLRCRPECAPGTPAWNGTSTTVKRGLQLIADGALDSGNIEQLAERLGVTSRHLRRLFTKHLGASPLAVAHTQRLQFAKRLLDETALPMTEIAVAAGYGSTRRFNDTFQKTYGRAPRDIRRRVKVQARTAGLTVRLPFRAPMDVSALLSFFAGRAIPGVEQVESGCYSRTVDFDGQHALIEVRADNNAVLLTLHGASTRDLLPLTLKVRAMFDLDTSPDDVHRVLRRDAMLRQLLRGQEGVRVPGAWDGFELTVRAILGQQISVAAATTLSGRIVERYGTKANLPADVSPDAPKWLFPTPQKLARARMNDMGIVTARIETIRRVAQAVLAGTVRFGTDQTSETFCRSLMQLKGIGEWTAQYVAMRILKDPDAFLHADLGLLRAFDTPGGERIKPGELRARAENWRPWRAYAAMLLWSADGNSGG